MGRQAVWGLFAVLVFMVALMLAWYALARANFFYSFWHDTIGIDRTIAQYGPQNRNRARFAETDRAERARLFAAIVQAIHRDGEGLEQLRYHTPAGAPIATLLTPPEVLHLRDVANLVALLPWAGGGALAAALVLAAVLARRRWPMPSVPRLFLALLALVLLCALVLWLSGPVRVFYWLHTVIFPPQHPWFFYYQDSLMSTMMQAPDLFGYIALAWVALALVLLAVLLVPARRVYGRLVPGTAKLKQKGV